MPPPGRGPGPEEGATVAAESPRPHDSTAPLAHRLERGEVAVFPTCQFAVPTGEAHEWLLQQRLASRAHKNISYDPNTGKAHGYLRHSAEQAHRLTRTLADFARHAT